MRELLPVADGRRTWAAVSGLLRAHRGLALGGFTVLLLGTAVGLVTPWLLGRIVDLVAGRDPADAIAWPVGWLVVVALVQGVATAGGVAMVARLGEGMLARLRERFVARALELPLGEVERAGSGDLTARVTRDVAVVADAVRNAMPVLAKSGLAIVLTLAGFAVLDWRFLLAALLALPVQVQAVRWYGGRALRVYAEHRVAVGAQQQQLLDTIGGASTVRALGMGAQQLGRVRERSESAVSLALRGIRLVTQFYGRVNTAELIGLGAVLVAGFVLVAQGSVSLGTATAAALYAHNLFNPVGAALALADDAQSAAASLARLVGVADRPAVAEPAGAVVPVDTTVKVSGVTFGYVQGHEVLHGVDLELAPGERVALVGESGAGKTTLAKLIAGVREPTGGTVTVGGLPLAELALRRTVALVTQEVHVFAGSLAADLRLARPVASEAELRSALDRVGALAWAEGLPDGLSTVVGEGGHRLTVAQAQQLALARLVLADPPVVILDEATAEAGSAGARVLEQAAMAALAGRTALVVAHRLTQAAAADRVVVLAGGRVVESGAHAELLRAGGRYAELWAAWSDGRGGAGTAA
ncbi:ABC transporter ATP-binding protein [Crossiella sp. CA198]|uniref:ABC transporter ATP-binding protein n=1 Tax=Crossiella sp. CA198 TaxID=3455607 RepID=UPI003F8D20E3